MRHHTLTACHPSGGGGGGGYTGPLDLTATPAVVAYGQRALSAAMLGQPLYRLRRDSDDAEMTFSSDAVTGDAPVAAITAWLGGANGFVTTWFDQSGNANNVAQPTAGYQVPWLASTTNSRPGLNFQTAADSTFLYTAGNVTITTGHFTVFAVLKDSVLTGINVNAIAANGPDFAFYGGTGAASPVYWFADHSDYTSENGGSSTDIDLSHYCIADSGWGPGVDDFYLNGVEQSHTSLESGDGTVDTISLQLGIGVGDVQNALQFGPIGPPGGQLLEYIIFPAVLSSSDRTAIRANDKAWYGTP